MNDKIKLIIYGSVAAAMFLLAALLPLAFRGGSVEAREPLSVGQRASIFSEYWWNEDSSNCQVERISDLGRTQREFCFERMEQVKELCFVDAQQGQIKSEGSEYISVTTEAGEIRLCRSWLECQGDWRNWIDVCFDIDSGDIYYFYISSECVSNPNKYSDAVPEPLDAERVAGYIADRRSYELMHLDWSGNASDSAMVIYNSAGSAVCMQISCIYYESTLIDLKICCV